MQDCLGPRDFAGGPAVEIRLPVQGLRFGPVGELRSRCRGSARALKSPRAAAKTRRSQKWINTYFFKTLSLKQENVMFDITSSAGRRGRQPAALSILTDSNRSHGGRWLALLGAGLISIAIS